MKRKTIPIVIGGGGGGGGGGLECQYYKNIL